MSDPKILEVEVFNTTIQAWQNGQITDVSEYDANSQKTFKVRLE